MKTMPFLRYASEQLSHTVCCEWCSQHAWKSIGGMQPFTTVPTGLSLHHPEATAGHTSVGLLFKVIRIIIP